MFEKQIYPLFLFESKAWISIFHQTFYKSHSFFDQIRFCQTYSILVLYACTWRIYKERLTINNINITFMFSDFYNPEYLMRCMANARMKFTWSWWFFFSIDNLKITKKNNNSFDYFHFWHLFVFHGLMIVDEFTKHINCFIWSTISFYKIWIIWKSLDFLKKHPSNRTIF